MSTRRFRSLVILGVLLFPKVALTAVAPTPIDLWPGTAPGETKDLGKEQDTTKTNDNLVAGKRVIRLGNVSKPTLTIYEPSKVKPTGAAVLVCPGGAYYVLALDLEGTEVCEWLNSIGVTAALLKYRVPRRAGLEKHAAPLQDAQRAMSLLRQRAPQLGIDPRRLGVLGFSAGAHLSAVLSTTTERTYPLVDDADQTEVRPSFTVLIYPAYLTEVGEKVVPELKITTNTPPTFIAMTQDDPVRVEGALYYSLALKQAKVPAELHIYPTGGHGYGLRRTKDVVTTWPDRVVEWMKAGGWLERK